MGAGATACRVCRSPFASLGPAVTQISVCGSAALLLTHLDPSKNACGELECDGLHLFIWVVLKHTASALGSARGLLVSVPVPNPELLYRSKVTDGKWEQNSASGLQSLRERCCSQCCSNISALYRIGKRGH